jgi:hypothetical protein
MIWTILVAGLTLALIFIGQIGDGLIYLLLAGAMLVSVIQLFTLLLSGDETMI